MTCGRTRSISRAGTRAPTRTASPEERAMIELHSWGLLAALGAFHGVNPGMGWLFAVALGLQERRRRAVLNALVPLGLGHALAVTAAVAVAALAGAVLSAAVVRAAVAAALLAFGGRRLLRHSHPAWASMRV